jgi:hypothetical protein
MDRDEGLSPAAMSQQHLKLPASREPAAHMPHMRVLHAAYTGTNTRHTVLATVQDGGLL